MDIFLIVMPILLFIMGSFVLNGIKSRAGKIPEYTGGKLDFCPTNAVNCVCSEYPEKKLYYLAPISIQGLANPLTKASGVIEAMGGVVHVQEDNYLAATFTSSFFGFVDDFQLRLDQDNALLHFRSASRVGKHDVFANKNRVKKFCGLFSEMA